MKQFLHSDHGGYLPLASRDLAVTSSSMIRFHPESRHFELGRRPEGYTAKWVHCRSHYYHHEVSEGKAHTEKK